MTTSTHAAPLPADVVVHASWFGRARQFPIFSGAWFRYRSAAFLTGLLATALLLAALAAIPLQPQNVDWANVLQVGAVYVLPAALLVLLGPALAVLVRRREWRAGREFAGILGVLVLGMGASLAAFFQLKHGYEAERVDRASGQHVIAMLPRPQLTLNWTGGISLPTIQPGAHWRAMTPKEREANDAMHRAHEDMLRLAPPAPNNTEPGLTQEEGAAMNAYLTAMSMHRTLTPEQERALRPGHDAYDKLLRYQARVIAGAEHLSPLDTPGSAAYRAAQERYLQAVTAFHRAQQEADPAASPQPASAPASVPAGRSAAGMAGAIVLLAATVLQVCWLGGITDLVAYVRQRGKLDDVLRDLALRRAEAARTEAELRMSVLAAQVEPHFLFNTLAGVRSAIVSDPARAAAIVDHLVDYLRASVPRMRAEAASAAVPLERQLDAVRAYLALMHERMPRLRFAVDLEPGLETAQVPPLMLISLVENAVKHGVEPKAGPARIAVSARRAEDAGEPALELQVVDDGVGFGSATSGTGLGLANIQQRLAGLYGSRAGLTLRALPDGGVAAILRLPLTFTTATAKD